jgi:hypothetical protein
VTESLKASPDLADVSAVGQRSTPRAAANHRSVLWTARWAVVRRNKVVFAATSGAVLLVLVAIGLIYSVAVGSDFLAGFVSGSLGVGFVAGLLWLVDAEAGKHNDRFGTYGEEATARLFETRRMRRAGWAIVHNIPFDGIGDVDHVVVGPAGVLVIESKWANTPWRVQGDSIDANGSDPVFQTRRAANKIKRFLATKGVDVYPQPVLVQWGPGGLPSDWTEDWIDGVLILRRPRGATWTNQAHAASSLDRVTSCAATDALETQRQRSMEVRLTGGLTPSR